MRWPFWSSPWPPVAACSETVVPQLVSTFSRSLVWPHANIEEELLCLLALVVVASPINFGVRWSNMSLIQYLWVLRIDWRLLRHYDAVRRGLRLRHCCTLFKPLWPRDVEVTVFIHIQFIASHRPPVVMQTIIYSRPSSSTIKRQYSEIGQDTKASLIRHQDAAILHTATSLVHLAIVLSRTFPLQQT